MGVGNAQPVIFLNIFMEMSLQPHVYNRTYILVLGLPQIMDVSAIRVHSACDCSP